MFESRSAGVTRMRVVVTVMMLLALLALLLRVPLLRSTTMFGYKVNNCLYLRRVPLGRAPPGSRHLLNDRNMVAQGSTWSHGGACSESRTLHSSNTTCPVITWTHSPPTQT